MGDIHAKAARGWAVFIVGGDMPS